MRPRVITSHAVIEKIIRNNASIFENKNLNEFLNLVKSSELMVSDKLELSETHPVIQQFYKLITEGVTTNFSVKQSDQSLKTQMDHISCFDYEFSNKNSDRIDHFKCTVEGFPIDFPNVGVTSIEGNQILGSELSDDANSLEKFGQLSHVTKKVMLYDRYIFRPFRSSRYHNIQNTVLPILAQVIKDFGILKEITLIGSDLYLPSKLEKCTKEDLIGIAGKIEKEISVYGFSGKVICAVINRRTDHYEHGRWLITDYLKFKCDDSWNFLNRPTGKGNGPDISIFPNYKRRHLEQKNRLYKLFEIYLTDRATLKGTN